MIVLNKQFRPKGQALTKSRNNPEINPVVSPISFPFSNEIKRTIIRSKSGTTGKIEIFVSIDDSIKVAQSKIKELIESDFHILLCLLLN